MPNYLSVRLSKEEGGKTTHMDSIVNRDALAVYTSTQGALKMPLETFIEFVWPSLKNSIDQNIATKKSQPYQTAVKADALRLHQEAQLRQALKGVEDLIGTRSRASCAKLFQQKTPIQTAIFTRCLETLEYGPSVDILRKLGVGDPELAFQNNCKRMCDSICAAWDNYSLKKKEVAFSAAHFHNYCTKHLSNQSVEPLVQEESNLIKLQPISERTSVWTSSDSESDEEMFAQQASLNTPPHEDAFPLASERAMPPLVWNNPCKSGHVLVPIASEKREQSLISVTPIGKKSSIGAKNNQTIALERIGKAVPSEEEIGHYSLLPPLFPHHHHRHHRNDYWESQKKEEEEEPEIEAPIEAPAFKRFRTLLSVLSTEKTYNAFYQAVKLLPELAKKLDGKGPFTVFVVKSTPTLRPQFGSNIEAYIVPERFSAEKIRQLEDTSGKLVSINQTSLPIVVNKTGISVGGAYITQSDINARNGIIHVISNVFRFEDPPATIAMDRIGNKIGGESRPTLKRIKQPSIKCMEAILKSYVEKNKPDGSFVLLAPLDSYLEDQNLGSLLTLNIQAFIGNHLYQASTLKPVAAGPKISIQGNKISCGQPHWNESAVNLGNISMGNAKFQVYGINAIAQPVKK